MMEGSKADRSRSVPQKISFTVAGLVFYNVVLSAVLIYGAHLALERFDKLQTEMTDVNARLSRCEQMSVSSAPREKREVLSQDVQVPSWLQRLSGVQGPPGRDGRDGLSGKDGLPGKDGFHGLPGKDAPSLAVIEKFINQTVSKTTNQEWTRLSALMPSYGGAAYVRYGRSVCPASADLIYKGQLAGPDYRSAGGGVNYQCLPSDPEYEVNAPNVPHSALGAARYRTDGVTANNAPHTLFPSNNHDHMIPCAVCEAKQRVTQLMIPAKTRCPSRDWTLEYKGYLMSSSSQYSPGRFISTEQFRSMYKCVDMDSERLSMQPSKTLSGALLYSVKAQCTGEDALGSCPPYQSNKALSCVVCTK